MPRIAAARSPSMRQGTVRLRATTGLYAYKKTMISVYFDRHRGTKTQEGEEDAMDDSPTTLTPPSVPLLPERRLREEADLPQRIDPEGSAMDATALLFTGASCRSDLVAAYP